MRSPRIKTEYFHGRSLWVDYLIHRQQYECRWKYVSNWHNGYRKGGAAQVTIPAAAVGSPAAYQFTVVVSVRNLTGETCVLASYPFSQTILVTNQDQTVNLSQPALDLLPPIVFTFPPPRYTHYL
jgi:hypothetical protein